jgi:4-amino-4-deoxy-L-arabinose transferase-like glycosyltransferase
VNFKLLKKNKLLFFLLLILFCFGIFLRVWQISNIPPGLSWDEASIGYNGWAVLKSGKDEWGETLPLHFQAFGEWKLPVYVYSTLPFIKLFGLNPLVVRLPSIIAGIFSAVVFGLIFFRLKGIKIGLASSLLFLFSFWGFSLSRAAFEANLAVFIFLLAILFIIYKRYLFAVILFSTLMYTYNGFRIFLPLFLVSFSLIYKNKLVNKKSIVLAGIFVLLMLPLARFILANRSAMVRFKQVTSNESSSFLLTNYTAHFQPQFLLAKGDDNLRHFPGKTGQFSWLTTALAFSGLFFLIKKKGRLERFEVLVLVGLLLSPIPASITDQSPHSLRSINFFLAWMFLAIIGYSYLEIEFKKWTRPRKLLILALVPVFLFQYGYFFVDYFTDYKTRSVVDWQAGYKQIFTNNTLDDFDGPVFITTSQIQPYIFYLFYKPQLVSSVSHDVAPPSFWHQSRLSRIKNFYFVGDQELQNYIDSRQHGIYIVDEKQKDLILKNTRFEPISIDGLAMFYIFEI